MIALSNSPLFINREQCTYLYQDRVHKLILWHEPQLATPLDHLLFNIKSLPQPNEAAQPQAAQPQAAQPQAAGQPEDQPWMAWGGTAPDHYARLERLLEHCQQQGLWQPEHTYCNILYRPSYDQARLKTILGRFYRESLDFAYRSIAPKAGAHLSYVKQDELTQVSTALATQLPNSTCFQHPTAECLAQQQAAQQLLALRDPKGQLAGVVNFEITGQDLYIAHLFKIPGTQVTHVLPQLVALAQSECAQRALKKVYLYHLKSNAKLTTLYSQAGLIAYPQLDLTYFLP